MLDVTCLFVCGRVCAHVGVCAAVQEERQRGKERGENEVESTSGFNEDMPVDKILDAELAVEPKTEMYSEGSPGNSVRISLSSMQQNLRTHIKQFLLCILRSGV